MCAVLGMLAVTSLAVADHNRKNRTTENAQLDEWYCEHRSTRCGRPHSDVLEDAWNRRELGYKIADAGLLAVAVLAGIALWRQRR